MTGTMTPLHQKIVMTGRQELGTTGATLQYLKITSGIQELVMTGTTTLCHLKIITTAQIQEINTIRMITGMLHCSVTQKYLLLNVFCLLWVLLCRQN